MAEPLIRNVSDTARWVAAYRERETLLPDPLFRDALAGRLAGDRGRAIAAQASPHTAWALVTRTKVIDDLVLQAVADGADCVLSLAAGFDTRPYRLLLPPELRWIEADLPALIAEKEELLRDEKPVCRLSREAVDLADPLARAAFLKRVTASSRRVLVITEGLVMYLDAAVVADLAASLAAEPAIFRWVLDFSSPVILKMASDAMADRLASAPFKFAPEDGLGFFERHGWKEGEAISLIRKAGQFDRLPNWVMRLLARLPQPVPRSAKGRWSIVARLERTAPAKR
ncbi:MAG: SAM-dependent methyltransferase [Nibricoccus sp.]